jgi:hypothetical protein
LEKKKNVGYGDGNGMQGGIMEGKELGSNRDVVYN